MRALGAMKRDVRGTYSGMAHLRPTSLVDETAVCFIAFSCRVAVFYNASFLFAGRRNSVQVLTEVKTMVSSKTFDFIEFLALLTNDCRYISLNSKHII